MHKISAYAAPPRTASLLLQQHLSTGGGKGNKNERAGSDKKFKTAQLTIHEEVRIAPSTDVPVGSLGMLRVRY